MRKRPTRLFVLTLVMCLAAGQSAAFDLQIGRLDFGPSPADTFGPRRVSAAAGAMFTIPFGDSGSRKSPPATVNGVDMTRFTQQNAKDSAIVLMLVGTLIAVGVLSATLVANSISSD